MPHYLSQWRLEEQSRCPDTAPRAAPRLVAIPSFHLGNLRGPQQPALTVGQSFINKTTQVSLTTQLDIG